MQPAHLGNRPPLLLQVVSTTSQILFQIPGQAVDIAQAFLDLMVLMMREGCIDAVLQSMAQYSSRPSTDLSLVRHFVFKTLSTCGPPYSDWFAASLVR